MEMTLYEAAMILGWLGAACSMCAYYLVSSGRFAADSLRYHALNIFACFMLVIACLSTGSWPSMVTNLLFIAIGVRMTWRVRDRLFARLRSVVTFPVRQLRQLRSRHRIVTMRTVRNG
ncbi:CBU_0592 family membrane protein [Schaalia vaccimaxillae]|uniref:CBU_0592 family membrane protein n=1 Tax=Schaalia vaccimaxillae TaxID=183916 RepID=UPI001FB0BD7D|nr:hypothetical protein [Schaalia vaccimaxillae]